MWGDLVEFFDLLGTPLYAAVALGITTWLVWRGLGWRSAAFVLLACAGVGFNAAFKAVMGVTPLWAEGRGELAELNYLSGHVVYAVVMAGSLAWIAHLHGRRDLAALGVAAVVVMGPTRIIGASHLPSDVLAGYLMGTAWLVAAMSVVPARRLRDL